MITIKIYCTTIRFCLQNKDRKNSSLNRPKYTLKLLKMEHASDFMQFTNFVMFQSKNICFKKQCVNLHHRSYHMRFSV